MTKVTKETIDKYKKILLITKVMTVLYILGGVPIFYLIVTGKPSLFGFDSSFWNMIFVMGLVVLVISRKLFLVCPNCGKYPGGFWDRYSCKYCGVKLK